jgi:hypothetical protein
MAVVTLISATGRLKNKIQIKYNMTQGQVGEILADAGLAYGSTNDSGLATIIAANTDTPTFGYGILQSNTFSGIPNGSWYVWAWADTSAGRFFSASRIVNVFSAGYELSDEGIAIANPIVIANGTEGKDKALFSDSSGLATWKPIDEMFAYGHYIGELYGGGIVVDVWKEGDEEKVLIASLEDLTSTDGIYDPAGDYYSAWAYGTINGVNANVLLIGTQASSMYSGLANTNAIVAITGTAGSAALVCSQYRGGGYEDWYLPSYYELNAIVNQSSIISSVLKKDSMMPTEGYWSSTETINDSAYLAYDYAFGGEPFNIGPWRKVNGAKIRAVRRESLSTGDGLILSLDATNSKSFSDSSYYLSGTSSRWACLVNRGMSSSYSFMLGANGTASGGTLTNLLTFFETTGLNTDIFNGTVGSWTLTNISSTTPTTPKLYNRGGESSFVSAYFTAAYADTKIRFETINQSIPTVPSVNLNIYVSVRNAGYDTPYSLLRQIAVTGTMNISVPLYQYFGKTISIKVTSPGSFYSSTTSCSGPSFDNIYVEGTNGGFQKLGPVYFPDQSGYLRFASTGTGNSATNGAYIDFSAPIGSATKITVEVWARLNAGFAETMLFGWNQYSVWMRGGSLGFNTANGDVYGISMTSVLLLGLQGKWAHYVFEMNSTNASYTNNKIYINGEEQTLSQVYSTEAPGARNFNNGNGRIGGWRSTNGYLFNGDISVFRIYNRALAKDEIVKNYSSGIKRYEIRPSILRDGLYYSIDFNNNASYSSDGSVSGPIDDTVSPIRSASLVITPTTTIPAVQRTSNRLTLGVRRLIFPGTTTANPYITWTNTSALQSVWNISASFWIYIDSSRTAEIIVNWNSIGNTIGPWEVFQEGTKINFRITGSGQQITRQGTKTIQLGRWTHVCATYDNEAKRMKTYIDSVLDVDYPLPSSFNMDVDNVGDVFVGQYPPTATGNRYPFAGSIANMQIYTRAIGKEEVKNNYESQKHLFDNPQDSYMFFSHELAGNPTFSISQNLQLDIPGKINDRILISNAGGNAIWADKSYLFDRPVNYRYIGELYGGGIIVGMWKYPSTVYNYLIMSLTDINGASGMQWSNVSTNATASSEYNGASNSVAIISQQGHSNSAAKLCDDYTGGGFTDWYLPSAQEILMGYNAGESLGYVLGTDNFGYRGFNKLSGIYWTSTELSGGQAIYLNIAAGSSGYGDSGGPFKGRDKSATYSVRAFRQVRVNERRPRWNYEEWTPEFFPIVDDWNPRPWDGLNWSITEVSIGTNPVYQEIDSTVNLIGTPTFISPTGSIAFTFSNVISTSESIISSGVCWSTSSVAPTISDSVAYSTIPSSGIVKTPRILGPSLGTQIASADYYRYFVYFRAFVTTPSGTYYSRNTEVKSDFGTLGLTYSTSPTSYNILPTGCFIWNHSYGGRS